MSPKPYRLIFASDSSTGCPSGFSKGNLRLYVGESVCDTNRSLTIRKTSCGDGAVGKSWATDMKVTRSKPLGGDQVFYEFNF